MPLLRSVAHEAEIEKALESQLATVAWIGELDIDRQDYDKLARALRHSIRGQYPYMTVTAMVFTVRYAEYEDDEMPNFWRKYARMVWGNTTADLSFQNEERRRFRQIRDRLMDRYGLRFPTRTETPQDVVRGIYLHAILPSYLQDDFANWLVTWFRRDDNWRELAQAPLEEIQAKWQVGGAVSLAGIRRRLRYFLEREESAPTAARLVQTLALAASEYLEGESSEAIRTMLSPIERDLWQHLLAVVEPLRQATNRQERLRERSHQFYFVWNLPQDTFGVMVKHWSTTGAAPDRLVWASSVEALSDYGRHFVSITPWQTVNGWEVDRAFLPLPQLGGVIGLVDQHDNVLASHDVPTLPNDPLLYFKISNDESFARLTPFDRISDGDYLILGRADCAYELRSARDDHVLKPRESLIQPELLRQAGYEAAQRYSMKLPVNLTLLNNTSEDQTYFIRNKRGAISALLEGKSLLPVKSTAVYHQAPKLRLVNASSIRDHVERLRLRLFANDQLVSEHHLSEIALHEEGEDLLIDLTSFKWPTQGMCEVKLQRNFNSVLNDALTFALVPPQVRFECSDPNVYYSYQHPFQLTLYGLANDQVNAPNASITHDSDCLHITWSDPLMPCAVQLRLAGSEIPLYFDVSWRHVWIEPEGSRLLPTDLNDTHLKIIGQRGDRFLFHIGQLTPRPVDLNASGSYTQRITHDPIYDMIRECATLRVPVYAADGQTTWPLFTVDHQVEGSQSAGAQQAIRSLRLLKRRTQSQTYIEALVSLLALPRAYLDDLPAISPAKLAHPFDMLKRVEELLPTFSAEIAPPVELMLQVSDDCILPVRLDKAPTMQHEASGRAFFTCDERIVRSANVAARVIDIGCLQVRFSSERDALFACSICGAVFINHGAQRAIHTHHLGLKAPRPRPVSADQHFMAHVRSPVRTPDQWELRFDDSRYDSLTLESIRIGRTPSAIDHVPLNVLTLQHVVAATIEMKPHLKALGDCLEEARTKPVWSVVQIVAEALEHIANDYLPAHPLLSILTTLMSNPTNRWERFPCMLVASAILYRATSRNQPQLTALFDQHQAIIQPFLVDVFAFAPMMVGWAWAWAELYMLYFDFIPHEQVST